MDFLGFNNLPSLLDFLDRKIIGVGDCVAV